MRPTEFAISEPERWMAEAVAAHRANRVEVQRLGAGHGDDRRDPDKVREDHLRGAVGEMVLSKFLDSYWDPGENDFGRRGDVRGFEVRATWHAGGHLAVYEDDPDGRRVVLITVGWLQAPPTPCRVVGWAYAGDLKTDENRRRFQERFPGSRLVCWWATQDQLHPFNT